MACALQYQAYFTYQKAKFVGILAIFLVDYPGHLEQLVFIRRDLGAR
jgi:hypothetical protein